MRKLNIQLDQNSPMAYYDLLIIIIIPNCDSFENKIEFCFVGYSSQR